jgi:hypothetical protein
MSFMRLLKLGCGFSHETSRKTFNGEGAGFVVICRKPNHPLEFASNFIGAQMTLELIDHSLNLSLMVWSLIAILAIYVWRKWK